MASRQKYKKQLAHLCYEGTAIHQELLYSNECKVDLRNLTMDRVWLNTDCFGLGHASQTPVSVVSPTTSKSSNKIIWPTMMKYRVQI